MITYFAFLFIGISIVDTFLFFPSDETRDSEPIFTSPTEYAGLVLCKTICTTSTAGPMLCPLALIVTMGIVDN